MNRVFKRIAVNGFITAVVLGVIGFMYAELAGLWLTGAATRTPQASDADLQGTIRSRVPVVMAVWGFVFIAVAEMGLYLWRGGSKAADAARPAPPPDEAEALLEELLKQAEAKAARERAATGTPNEPGASILTPNP